MACSSGARLDGRELIRYTWPPLLSSLGGIVVGFTDSLLISYYSTAALAGVSLGAALYEVPLSCLMGALMAHRILAPRSAQNRDTAGLRIVLRPLAMTAAATACALSVLAVLSLSVVSHPIWAVALQYTAARAPSLVAETVSTAFVITVVSWGRTRAPLLVLMLTAPANLLLDTLLVYGSGPLPELGAVGAGIGSSVAAFLPLPFLLRSVRSPPGSSRASSVSGSTVSAEDVYENWPQLAWPAVGSALVDYVGNMLFAAVLAGSGAAVLAGVRFGMQLHVVVFVVISSLSSGCLYVVGGAMGADGRGVAQAGRAIRPVFRVVGVGLGALVALFGSAIAPFVSPDPEVGEGLMFSSLVVGALTPIAAMTYGEVTLLRIGMRTGRELLANGVAVWCAQLPLAAALQVLFAGCWPMGGLVGYWLVRLLVSRAGSLRLVNESST